MNGSLKEKLVSTFNDVEVTDLDETRTAVIAPPDSMPVILRYLKENGLDHLALVSCVDWYEKEQLEVVYILSSYMRRDTEYAPEQQIHLFLKTRIPRGNPELKSIIDIFPIAEPYEREIHELFGVRFEGHPRLIPLFLERAYEIPPFRKDFDTRKYVEETFGSIPSVEE